MTSHARAALVALALIAAAPLARAQTAAELVTVAALSAALDPSVNLPRGSFQVTNPAYAQAFTAQLGADANRFTAYQLYVATGIASRLADAFVNQLETNFLSAGYLKDATSTTSANGEVRTRSTFSGDAGTLLLYVVRRADRVFFLVARSK